MADQGPPQSCHVDCADCAVRGPACSECIVTVLLGSSPCGVAWDDTERAAVDVLSRSGLVPPLRLVPRRPDPVRMAARQVG